MDLTKPKISMLSPRGISSGGRSYGVEKSANSYFDFAVKAAAIQIVFWLVEELVGNIRSEIGHVGFVEELVAKTEPCDFQGGTYLRLLSWISRPSDWAEISSSSSICIASMVSRSVFIITKRASHGVKKFMSPCAVIKNRSQ